MSAWIMFNVFNSYGTSDTLEYGDLIALHPGETFAEIKARRESNFTKLKTILESGTYTMPARRLEVSIPTGEYIQSSTINLYGSGKLNSTLVVYPFLPTVGQQRLIDCRYGDTHNIRNLTIKSPVKNNLYETYSCILKPSGNANQIQILGSVRSGFWSEMIPGKSVWYGWTFSTLGENKVISSVDEGTATITLTTNISESVSSNTQGANVNFGTAFKESISESDCSTYGRAWVVNFYNHQIIYGIPAASTGTDYTGNYTNVSFENMPGTTISMGNAKLNLDGCDYKGASVGLSFFARGNAGGQKLTIDNTLLIEDCGDLVAGAVTVSEPSGNYGAGGYLHDSIIVKCNGTLHLKDNTSASWRQYSSSYGPATGDFSHYANIVEEGSIEYGFLMSNTMPTVIDNITSTGTILARHDTTINGGNMAYFSVQGTDFGVGDRTCLITDTTLRGTINLAKFKTATLTNCTFSIPLFSSIQVMITPAETTTVDGGEIVNGGSIGTVIEGSNPTGSEGARLSYCGSSSWNTTNLTIDGLVIPNLYMYLLSTNAGTYYYNKDGQVILNNLDINCYGVAVDGLSSAGTVSNIMSGTNNKIISWYSQNAGRGFVQNIQGKTGTASKTVVASATYALIGALTNILEIDFEHNYFETNGSITAIIAKLWAGSTKYSGNTAYGRNIRLYAVGGDITLSTFDASLRPTSNIIGTNGTVITNGNYLDITIDRDYVFKTGSTSTTPTVATGNGATKIYTGVLSHVLLDPTVTINVTAGAVNVNADANGVLNDAALVGIVDPWTGKYDLRFTSNVGNGTPIVVTYNYPNVWKNTGAFILP